MERDLSTSAPADVHIHEETQSAVSWGAVIAGAVAALALSFVLMGLAAGFGFTLASPWPGQSAPDGAFTPIVGSVMIVVQVLSCALGGYLAGRLRTRWLNVHDHEVHFRDTAHGLLVWALSTVIGIVMVTTVLAPSAARLADAAVDQSVAAQEAAGPPGAAIAAPDPAALAVEAKRDANIAAQMSFFMAFGLLLSGFVASVAAAIGGMRRDEMVGRYHAERPKLR